MREDVSQMTDEERRTLLEAALTASGRTLAAFAAWDVVREDGSVRKWRRGEVPIPDVVVRKLLSIVEGRGP